ncbi:hypothetical protein ABNC94_20860, partial [Paenibacillus larvae]
EGYEYGSFHFLEPSFLHNYTDSTLWSNNGDKPSPIFNTKPNAISCSFWFKYQVLLLIRKKTISPSGEILLIKFTHINLDRPGINEVPNTKANLELKSYHAGIIPNWHLEKYGISPFMTFGWR